MINSYKTRNTGFALLGAAGLILVKWYDGFYYEIVHSYGGNLCASFAVYFIVRLLSTNGRLNRIASAAIALLIVDLFEATNGFGVMANTYDPIDFIANAIGIALAVVVDLITSRFYDSRKRVTHTDR